MTETQTCTVYPWCAETGQHTVHASAYTAPAMPDGNGDWILPANLMAADATVFVGWLGEDLTPTRTRRRIAELRRHLDAVAALADIVDGRAPVDGLCTVAAPGTDGALIGAEILHLDDPAPGGPIAHLAVYSEQGADADLDVTGADKLIADLETFLPQLRALRNHLAAILGAGGGSPAPAAAGGPGHYPWCNTSACITHEYEERDGGGTYTEHIGHETSVTVSDDGHPEDTIAVAVGLGADESFTGGTQVYVNVGDLNGLAFNPAGVDKLIGQLDTLTSALRTMRGQMDSEARP
ncbi:DUF6907 domain-containing protein [Streptomyces griseus]|uniref:DUF6907 domain-containing protein n=1 Tax=Streptomyces griseus TaxID=1911 RepID=UPI0033BE7BEA